jgi:hypothetical protein
MALVDRLLLSYDGQRWRVWVKDPIDGGSVLREASRNDMFEWCEHSCRGRYWIGIGFGDFEHEDDATLFRMRWS